MEAGTVVTVFPESGVSVSLNLSCSKTGNCGIWYRHGHGPAQFRSQTLAQKEGARARLQQEVLIKPCQ